MRRVINLPFLRPQLIKNRNINRSLSDSNQSTQNDDSSSVQNKESPLKRLLNDSASFEDTNYQPSTEQRWSTTPYPRGTKTRLQGDYFSNRPKGDPRENTIFLFPGQGAQYVGMCKDLLKFPMVTDLFDLANYILDYDLLKICLEGPNTTLNETIYAQPAIFVSSLAAVERLKEERPGAIDSCVATAGFSLGEITALTFAGALPFEQALKLVQIRAEAMQMCSKNFPGGMLTLFYGPDSKIGFAIKEAKLWATDKGDPCPECIISNYLYPHCKVVAGSQSALEYLEQNHAKFNIKKVKRLAVSGGFHSNLMLDAVKPFKKALYQIDIQEPAVSVYSNVDGKRYRDVEHIRRQLPKQIIKPVKWEQLLHVVYERAQDEYFPNTFECGPGTSLRTIIKQVNAKAWTHCLSIEA